MSQPTETVDAVVVGGGLAGVCAAVTAAENGADVVLLEREPELGGSTVLSGGFFALTGTPMQRDLGIDDSPDLLYDDLRAAGGYQNDEELVRRYADAQVGLYDWLTGLGVTFNAVELSAGQSVARSHQTHTPELIRTLAAHAADGTAYVSRPAPR